MVSKLRLRYDRDADIFHITSRPSYPEQETDERGDDVIGRLNPQSLEVWFFSTRLQRSSLFELPLYYETKSNLRRCRPA